MIHLWNGQGGVCLSYLGKIPLTYYTYDNLYYLLYLCYLCYLCILISLINAIINWYDTAFGDSDDEDLNDTANPGEIMEGGGGEVLNEAGTYNMSYPIHVSYLSHL